ncbi:hypothetical protein HPP92_007464 [Vanilla planifolia]|uniref:Uncharacterized protein n=1 Tax=Vanilla planifolia TaxID=51239 RepID=A0A835VBV8_VANPL|nr:hypothetical protein HPP92_007647 [Vanilla planifolia]KAG0490601.1 hypothetical protein HPP92_007464 [Vanilla planifolia]
MAAAPRSKRSPSFFWPSSPYRRRGCDRCSSAESASGANALSSPLAAVLLCTLAALIALDSSAAKVLVWILYVLICGFVGLSICVFCVFLFVFVEGRVLLLICIFNDFYRLRLLMDSFSFFTYVFFVVL